MKKLFSVFFMMMAILGYSEEPSTVAKEELLDPCCNCHECDCHDAERSQEAAATEELQAPVGLVGCGACGKDKN